jgi:hypothetical protein
MIKNNTKKDINKIIYDELKINLIIIKKSNNKLIIDPLNTIYAGTINSCSKVMFLYNDNNKYEVVMVDDNIIFTEANPPPIYLLFLIYGFIYVLVENKNNFCLYNEKMKDIDTILKKYLKNNNDNNDNNKDFFNKLKKDVDSFTLTKRNKSNLKNEDVDGDIEMNNLTDKTSQYNTLKKYGEFFKLYNDVFNHETLSIQNYNYFTNNNIALTGGNRHNYTHNNRNYYNNNHNYTHNNRYNNRYNYNNNNYNNNNNNYNERQKHKFEYKIEIYLDLKFGSTLLTPEELKKLKCKHDKNSITRSWNNLKGKKNKTKKNTNLLNKLIGKITNNRIDDVHYKDD